MIVGAGGVVGVGTFVCVGGETESFCCSRLLSGVKVDVRCCGGDVGLSVVVVLVVGGLVVSAEVVVVVGVVVGTGVVFAVGVVVGTGDRCRWNLRLYWR